MISGLIVSFAYWINGAPKYKELKASLHDILNNIDNPYKRYVDMLMIFLIITSVGILVYEVQHPVPRWMDLYDIYFVTFVFLVEYLLRLWVVSDLHKPIIRAYEEARFLEKKFSLWKPLRVGLGKKLRYMVSAAALIDLLAILPAYRPVRILRIFVLFRVFKLLRYTRSINQFIEVLAHKRFELFTLLFLLIFIMVASGIAIYVFEERANPQINTLFDAMYWALVTISTVGYGDIAPVTHEGKMVSMVIIISGLGMISFMTSVIVSAFSEKLGELKESRIIKRVNKNSAFLILCGYGQMTRTFLRENRKAGHAYVILDKDEKKVALAIKEGYHAIHNDASRHEVLAQFNVLYSEITVLCLTNSDIENLYIALNAKSVSRKIKVIARAMDTSMKKKFELAGVDHVVMPNAVANMMLTIAITQPTMYNGMHAILTGEDVAYIDEVKLSKQSLLVGKQIHEVDFKASKLLLIGIQRGEQEHFIFNPKGALVFQEEDILLLMGLEMSIRYFKERYCKGRG